MTDIAFTLSRMWPGAQWSLDGDSYEGLTWLDDTPKPTLKELEDAYPALAEAEAAKNDLAATDADMARVAEDIIGLLIGKGVFTTEEMPESVRDKIQEREALRSQINERKR